MLVSSGHQGWGGLWCHTNSHICKVFVGWDLLADSPSSSWTGPTSCQSQECAHTLACTPSTDLNRGARWTQTTNQTQAVACHPAHVHTSTCLASQPHMLTLHSSHTLPLPNHTYSLCTPLTLPLPNHTCSLCTPHTLPLPMSWTYLQSPFGPQPTDSAAQQLDATRPAHNNNNTLNNGQHTTNNNNTRQQQQQQQQCVVNDG